MCDDCTVTAAEASLSCSGDSSKKLKKSSGSGRFDPVIVATFVIVPVPETVAVISSVADEPTAAAPTVHRPVASS